MEKNKKLLLNQKGFLLMEVVAGIFIIGLIVLALNNLPQSIKLVGRAQKESLAKQIAIKALEDQRAKTWTNLPLTNGTTVSDSRLSSLPNGSGSFKVVDCPVAICTNSEHTKQLTVTVTWSESGLTKSVQLVTLVSEGGLH